MAQHPCRGVRPEEARALRWWSVERREGRVGGTNRGSLRAMGTWLIVVNCVACFIEGGLGFGGSLTFLALTVPLLGWTNGVATDCLLAAANLAFVAFLHRDSLGPKRVLRVLPAALVGLATGTLVFLALPGGWRSVPILCAGGAALFGWIRVPRWLLAPVAGLGVGLGNTEEPFGYLLFQSHGRGIGDTAAFVGTLLFIKAGTLTVASPELEFPAPATLMAAVLLGAPFSLAGRHLLGPLDAERRRTLVKALVATMLALLALGGWFAP